MNHLKSALELRSRSRCQWKHRFSHEVEFDLGLQISDCEQRSQTTEEDTRRSHWRASEKGSKLFARYFYTVSHPLDHFSWIAYTITNILMSQWLSHNLMLTSLAFQWKSVGIETLCQILCKNRWSLKFWSHYRYGDSLPLNPVSKTMPKNIVKYHRLLSSIASLCSSLRIFRLSLRSK